MSTALPASAPPETRLPRRLIFALVPCLVLVAAVMLGLWLLPGPRPGPRGAKELDTYRSCALQVAEGEARLECLGGVVLARAPMAHPDRRRVVFLGESSLRLPAGAAVPDALAARMPAVDVVNLAFNGATLEQLTVLARGSAVLTPDLLVVYAGHNEYSRQVFNGDLLPDRMRRDPRGTRWLSPWELAMSVVDVKPPIPTDRPDFADRLATARVSLAQGLGTIARESRAPVVLCTLLRNPTEPPTGVLAAGMPDCAAALPGLLDRGRLVAERLERAEEVCGEGSLTWWLRAQRAREEGRLEAARAAFATSTELDTLPLRAPVSADEAIRQVGAACGARVVDLGEALGPWPPGSDFTDLLHLSASGAEAVAAALEPVVRERLE